MTETINIWCGEAELYADARPAPPSILLDICTQLVHTPQPILVVDLGSGTGLSTVIWAEHARQVIGIEPNADMRFQAAQHAAAFPRAERVRYQDGLSTRTGLPSDCADMVTCSQSLHWMEPEPTFAEVVRILKPGGLFAAYDYDWPPTVHLIRARKPHAFRPGRNSPPPVGGIRIGDKHLFFQHFLFLGNSVKLW
jgi:SAM-dependent methyltransferase